jgi:hypothetical protein
MTLPGPIPPVTSTVPSFNNVAVCASRAACKPPVPANVPLVALKSSAAARIFPLKSLPPAISTVPSLSNVAVCPARAPARDPNKLRRVVRVLVSHCLQTITNQRVPHLVALRQGAQSMGLRCRNFVSQNVQVSGAETLIHEALGILRSRRRSIGSRRTSHDRRLNLSILVPLVEARYVYHL